MSSSDRTDAPSKAVGAESPVAPIPAPPDDSKDDRDDDALTDSWFAPGPKRAAASGDEPPEWFLPAGRAGLLPDSITDSWHEGSPRSPDRPAHGEAAGSPPWGAEPTKATAGVPPPWETGPWPGPGDPQLASRPAPPAASPDLAPATTGLRRRSVQLVVAAGVSVVLVVIIVVVVAMTSGSPGGGCGTYPAAVRQAYLRAMTDMHTNAPVSVQSAAFALAASKANASAATASQIAVRTAMFGVASDLNQAYADVTANRALPTALLQHLTADATALPTT
jgi:hypothetical protein